MSTFTKTCLFIGLFFALVFASNAHAEVIKTFDSQITVNKDASVSVVETIVYDSEGLEKHGIYRDITPRNAKGEKMMLKDISVATPSGSAYQWSRLTDNGNVRLKIGDPNATFAGEKTYVIRYTATNAVSYFDSYDEIYWNVTGNAWPFAIQKASASVLLPDTTTALQQACYVGPVGSKETCDSKAVRSLGAGEGFTIAASFPKAIVTPYVHTTQDKIAEAIGLWWPVLIPLSVLIYMWRKWYRIGRDAKGRGTIVPEYDVVDHLTPLEAAVILHQKISPRDMVAEILYLATKGYIAITRVEEKGILSKKVDYTLHLEKLPGSELAPADVYMLGTLFGESKFVPPKNAPISLAEFKNLASMFESPAPESLVVGSEIILSKRPELIGVMGALQIKVKTFVVEKEYYTKDFLPKEFFTKKNFGWWMAIVVVLVIASSTNLFELLLKPVFLHAETATILVCIGGVLLSLLIIFLFKRIMPAKTQKGAIAREHLLGLKQYIDVAEKDRIDFHNAPEKSPALFEHLLPYAVVFGLEKKWAAAFESILVTSPSWYHAGDLHAFSAVAFASSINRNFSTALYSSISTGSGSGGGGFSGGGGGGGGGGSW